eukprot:CAMPEP_0115692488 /NCGR_PEP_ID=MMETSP0272-20121206/63224_1 /TAXON_ID=71861 /ORGANISM="Scrippsiella trochoidea, Strain CCMP3099" /LENGTH=117 /DNA_ID=CAMNT_0003132553 /DNA_START=151 /DNA_END=501 /DNA_ORIENTATION=+
MTRATAVASTVRATRTIASTRRTDRLVSTSMASASAADTVTSALRLAAAVRGSRGTVTALPRAVLMLEMLDRTNRALRDRPFATTVNAKRPKASGSFDRFSSRSNVKKRTVSQKANA